MTYTHLSTDELVIIESHFKQKTPVTQIAESIKRSRQNSNECHIISQRRAQCP